MAKALELSNLSLKSGGRLILSDVNMELEKGSTAAVCGNTQSGSNQLVNAILRTYGRQHTIKGSILVNGIKIAHLSDNDIRYVRMLDIGILPGVLEAPKYITVKEYLSAPFCETVKKSKNDIILDAKGIMNLMGIRNPDAIMRKKMTALRDKELRAVVYSAALSTDPSLIISTGPDSGLTPEEADEIFTLVIKICKIKNSGFLLITPDINLATRYCQKTHVLDGGKVVESFVGHAFSSNCARLLHAAASKLPNVWGEASSEVVLNVEQLQLRRSGKRLDFSLKRGEVLGVHTPGTDTFRAISSKKALQKISLNNGGMCITSSHPHNLLPSKTRVYELLNQQFAQSGIEFKTRRAELLEKYFEYGKLNHDILDLYPGSLDQFTAMKLFAVCAAASKRTLIICNFHNFMGVAEQYEIANIILNLSQSEGLSAILFSERKNPLTLLCHRVIGP